MEVARMKTTSKKKDDYRADIFRERAIQPEVAEDRGYRRYDGDLAPLFEADRRYETESFTWADGSPDTFRRWVEKKTKKGALPGWIMPKHAVPRSPFDDPLAQLRPDAPVYVRTWRHRHYDMPPGMLAVHMASRERQKEHEKYEAWRRKEYARLVPAYLEKYERFGIDADDLGEKLPDGWMSELHPHAEWAKYLLPPGPHGKRWDTHPRCTPDAFRAAERVFLHLEGCLKLDALVSAGEVGADVPSVTLWNRDGALSWVDWPTGKPTAADFWTLLEVLEEARELQRRELELFLAECVRAPVIVVCDSDWRYNPAVALEAFSLRDIVRDAGLECAVAAPPPGPNGGKQGSDDFQYNEGGTPGRPDDLLAVVPLPHEAPGRVDFEKAYRRNQRGASGRRRPSNTVDLELAVLDWYATHATEEGFVRRPATRIGKRLGVSADTVKRATLRLENAGALKILGDYGDPDERPTQEQLDRWKAERQRRPPRTAPLIRLRRDLAARWEPTVGRWLRTL
jgi:hypothetical protein